jgi:hypothetical protein
MDGEGSAEVRALCVPLPLLVGGTRILDRRVTREGYNRARVAASAASAVRSLQAGARQSCASRGSAFLEIAQLRCAPACQRHAIFYLPCDAQARVPVPRISRVMEAIKDGATKRINRTTQRVESREGRVSKPAGGVALVERARLHGQRHAERAGCGSRVIARRRTRVGCSSDALFGSRWPYAASAECTACCILASPVRAVSRGSPFQYAGLNSSSDSTVDGLMR